MKIINMYRNIPFVIKLVAGLFLGFIIGLLMGDKAQVFSPLGTLFMRLLMMAAIPLIFFNLMHAVASLNDPKLLGRIGLKIFLYYTATTILAAIVGVAIATAMKPGSSIILEGNYENTRTAEVPSIVNTIIEMVPDNIFQALSEGNLSCAIVFSTFVGVAIIFLKNKEKQQKVVDVLDTITQIMFQIVKFVLGLAPFGVFALVAKTTGTYGSALAGFLIRFIATIILGCLGMIILYCLSIALLGRNSPFIFLKKVIPSIVTAFSTASSMASIPSNLEVSKKLGISEKVYGFTIPLGAQINKDGLTLLLAVSCVAAGQAIGTGFQLGTIFQMVLMSVLLTYGASGVPGGSLVLISLMVETFAFPTEIAGIISGIFALIEMIICVPNVVGDVAGTFIVDKSEKSKGRIS